MQILSVYLEWVDVVPYIGGYISRIQCINLAGGAATQKLDRSDSVPL